MLILILLLAGVAGISGAQEVFTGVDRVVAVGDVHGDYDALVSVLDAAGVVDKRARWIGGKTHLVQMGDLPDRGPETRKIMNLLINLEKQASKAGGRVHCLIGNHDAMNLYGDLRYTTIEEFSAFRTGDSGQIRANFWDEYLRTLPEKPDDAAKKKWETEHPLGWFEHRYYFGPQGTYGKWIRGHNAAVKIDDSLFVHGGIGPKYAGVPLAEINRQIRAKLNDLTTLAEGDIVTGSDGPLWYRGLAQDTAEVTPEYVDQLLKAYEVKRIVIGHTPTAGAVLTRFDGKVVMVDVGLSAVYGGRRASLVIDRGDAYAIQRGERLKLPGDAEADYLRYLKQALAADPRQAALENFVSEFAVRLAQPGPK